MEMKRLGIRIADVNYDFLEEECERHGFTKSQYISMLLINAKREKQSMEFMNNPQIIEALKQTSKA